MKVVGRVAFFLVTFLAGASVGYWLSLEGVKSREAAFDLAELGYYSSFHSIQMAEGNDSTKEEAIRHHLALIETRQSRQTSVFPEKVGATDSALGYARLSDIAAKRGDNETAQLLLSRATTYCPKIGWVECTSERILSVARQLDKQAIVSSASK